MEVQVRGAPAHARSNDDSLARSVLSLQVVVVPGNELSASNKLGYSKLREWKKFKLPKSASDSQHD